jgi:hypothetical protein
MRTYHQLVFDDFVVGTGKVYTASNFNPLLALADKMKIIVVADQVTVTSGGNPTLTLKVFESPDNRNFQALNASPEISAALVVGAQTILTGQSDGTKIMSGFGQLEMQFTAGAGPQGHLKIYVTGRAEMVAGAGG